MLCALRALRCVGFIACDCCDQFVTLFALRTALWAGCVEIDSLRALGSESCDARVSFGSVRCEALIASCVLRCDRLVAPIALRILIVLRYVRVARSVVPGP